MLRVEANFDGRWNEGQVLGWEDRGGPGAGGEEGSAQQSIVDLDEFDTVEELMDPDLVGADKIKEVGVPAVYLPPPSPPSLCTTLGAEDCLRFCGL